MKIGHLVPEVPEVTLALTSALTLALKLEFAKSEDDRWMAWQVGSERGGYRYREAERKRRGGKQQLTRQEDEGQERKD